MCIKLRPHHLFCLQGYEGRGYSEEFVANMDIVYDRLFNGKNIKVNIVFCCDDLCCHCPEKRGSDLCASQKKVKTYDQKIIDFLQLEEKTYNFHELISKIKNEITEEKLDDICSTCSWYKNSLCRKNILSLKK